MSELASIVAGLAPKVPGSIGDYGFPIPNANFGNPISSVPRETLNDAAPNVGQQQIMTAAAGSVIGFGYGRCRVGIKVLFPIVDATGGLLVPGFVGKGPIDAVETVELDNAALLAGVTHTDYTGTATQTADAALLAAWLLQGKSYADAMLGTAYIVLRIPGGQGYRFGNVTVTARMLKVYDPRLDSTTTSGSGSQRLADDSTWTWSQNPVLALAHFLSTAGFGPEETMDWDTVATCADVADEQLVLDAVTQTRRQIGIFFDQQQSVDAIEETLRSYAGVFVVREDDVVRLIPDAAAAVVYSFTNGDRYDTLLLEGGSDHPLIEGGTDRILLEPATATLSNYLLDSLEIGQRSRANAPTVVTIRYTDTAQTPWAQTEIPPVMASGVEDGSLPWVESVIDWPGCQSAGMAYREAVRRINEFNLADTTLKLTGTDEALQLRRGDVCDVTDGEGFDRKPYRVTDVYPIAPGRWAVAGTEYQDGLYSDTVYTGPTIPDSNIPGASSPPAVTGLTVAEEPYLEQYAVTATQARLTWTAPVWPFLRDYWVVASIGGVKQFEFAVLPSGDATDAGVTPRLRPGELYSFAVYVRSSVATGSPTYIGLRPVGKSSPPDNVSSISGFSVDGSVFLSWTEATDDDQIHIRYELRYGATSGSWATATSIQKIAALHYQVPGIPTGTWRFWVKAIDSIGQESASAAYKDLTVTDTGPLAVTDATFIAPTVVQMERNDVASQAEPRWVSDNGDAMGYGHVDTDDATGVFIDANVLLADTFVEPTTQTTSRWTSEEYDHGSIVMASWAAQLPYRALTGAVDFTLWLSEDTYSWTAYPGGIALNVAARYAYIEAASDASGDAFAVDGYGTLQIVQSGAAALRPTAVTTETITPDTTVTVVIEGVTIKLAGVAVP